MRTAELTQSGLVVACFGNRGLLETASGAQLRYVLKGRKLRAVCGDRVAWDQGTAGGEARVTEILQRRNALNRINNRGQTEILASNLDQILVVTAASPVTDFFLVDRFLCAAEILSIDAHIIWNKTDIQDVRPAELSEYRGLGYTVLATSTMTNAGMGELEQLLATGVSMLVGQSGVGKSSLINNLIPGTDASVGEISTATLEGKHTTTASMMHKLPGGGQLIDSPGVREFVPAIDTTARIQAGYREIVSLADECRFTDCRHIREPGCAVKSALEQGKISARRYESYKRLHLNAAPTQ